eukprot:TRINITY_DN732_c0_g2_i1.p1 TRINITY_DN732_c0_g2~~TRINITY_DN732_c0_g2_i1.p1  ORF type:complete len:144 (-),score=54.96 TRINITY_DN732_c0_g2_i1:170-601(-)
MVKGATKAKTAAKAVKQGVNTKTTRKIRTSVHFHRPKTLRKSRDPKYPRRSVIRANKLDEHAVVQYPVTTEAAMKLIEERNTLVFLVAKRANKFQIKNAFKTLYDVEAAKVNTLIRPDGYKKAYIRLSDDYEALDVANRIGII